MRIAPSVRCILLLLILVIYPVAYATPDSRDTWVQYPWSVAAYGAQKSEENLGHTLVFMFQPQHVYLFAGEIGYAMKPTMWLQRWLRYIRAHAEINMNLAYTNDQRAIWYFNPFVSIVFDNFIPKNRYFNLYFEVGEGISYATSIPYYERKPKHDIYSTNLLNYLMFELGVTIPRYPRVAVFFRVHHRSGAWGLYYPYKDGDAVGSNFYGLGVRYRF